MELEVLETLFEEFKNSLKNRWDYIDVDLISINIHSIPAKDMPRCSTVEHTDGVGDYLIKRSKKNDITIFSKTIKLD